MDSTASCMTRPTTRSYSRDTAVPLEQATALDAKTGDIVGTAAELEDNGLLECSAAADGNGHIFVANEGKSTTAGS